MKYSLQKFITTCIHSPSIFDMVFFFEVGQYRSQIKEEPSILWLQQVSFLKSSHKAIFGCRDFMNEMFVTTAAKTSDRLFPIELCCYYKTLGWCLKHS